MTRKSKKQTKSGTILTGNAGPLTKDEIFWAVAGRLDKDHRAIADTETLKDFLNLLDDYILPYWLEIRSKAVLEDMPGLTSHSEVMLLILRNHIVKLNSTSLAIMLLPLPNDWDELEYWSATVRKMLKAPSAGKTKEDAYIYDPHSRTLTCKANGKEYKFNPSQGTAVKMLYEAWKSSDKVGVLEKDIGGAVDSTATPFQLRNLFRISSKCNQAWTDKIIERFGKGSYRLKTFK